MPYEDGYEDEFEDDDDDEFSGMEEENITLACEDCDYRWKASVMIEDDEYDVEEMICPMCGSGNVTDI